MEIHVLMALESVQKTVNVHNSLKTDKIFIIDALGLIYSTYWLEIFVIIVYNIQ